MSPEAINIDDGSYLSIWESYF